MHGNDLVIVHQNTFSVALLCTERNLLLAKDAVHHKILYCELVGGYHHSHCIWLVQHS